MKRHLVPSLCALVLALAAVSCAAQTKPNILVIVADDLGYGDLGVHGGKDVPTPNLDALAAAGTRCTSGYVSSPVCSPSRAGFLTGRYQTFFGHEYNPRTGDETKLGLPLDQRTIADYLHGVGYATGLSGKWHLGFAPAYLPQARGFDDFFGFLVAMHNYVLHASAEPKFEAAFSQNMIYRGTELQKIDGYTTDVFTDEAIAFMKHQSGKPWFLYLAYNAVHAPLTAYPKYASRVPASITDPDRRAYLSLLIGLDDNVGRVLKQLRESGQEQNTLIAFFSDNGGSSKKNYLSYNAASNAPLRGHKGQLLEGGVRVPFLLAWPGKIPAGKTYDQPVISLDITATAIKAAGVALPANLDGVDLLPFLAGTKAGSPHEALYWRLGLQKAARKGNWKLVDWYDTDAKKQSGWQLFDLSKDIAETNDVAAQNPKVVEELTKDWAQWDTKNIAPLWEAASGEDARFKQTPSTGNKKKGKAKPAPKAAATEGE